MCVQEGCKALDAWFILIDTFFLTSCLIKKKIAPVSPSPTIELCLKGRKKEKLMLIRTRI